MGLCAGPEREELAKAHSREGEGTVEQEGDQRCPVTERNQQRENDVSLGVELLKDSPEK